MRLDICVYDYTGYLRYNLYIYICNLQIYITYICRLLRRSIKKSLTHTHTHTHVYVSISLSVYIHI